MPAMKESFSGMKPIRLRISRAWVRISRPRMRAVPEVGLWKPSSVLIRVDLPAPLGPSRPIALPVSEAFRFFRIARCPKRTSRPSSSITDSMHLFQRILTSRCSLELAEWQSIAQRAQKISAHQVGHAARKVACARNRDAVGLAVRRNHHWLDVAEVLHGV